MKPQMPQVDTAFNGWQGLITLLIITQSSYNGNLQETEQPISFIGTIQPNTDEKNEVKNLGQFSWNSLKIHTKTFLKINIGDKVKYDGQRYKLMEKKDFSLNGYYRYILIRDYVD